MLSSHLAWENIANYDIFFVPLADVNTDSWNNFLKKSFDKHPKKKLFSILREKFSEKFSENFIKNFAPHLEDIFV